jgi:N-acetylmuramoyl-L-alanine amidase
MNGLRRAGLALFAIFLAALACERSPARSEEPAAPAAAKPAPKSEPKPEPKPEATNCKPAAFRVVVDVGHTAAVAGALSARGADEYDFNLHLAQDIKQALLDAGFDKTVLLITVNPPHAGLFERATRANAMAADLFISIHHDSVPDRLLETWSYNGQDNHYNDNYPGYALFISNDNPNHAASLLFGQFLGHALQARGLKFTSHYILPIMGSRRRILVDPDAGVYRYDQLIVLRQTRMPALLLEAGSIVNRREELELATPERRALTSAAVAQAVEEFCAARAHPTATAPAAAAERAAKHRPTAHAAASTVKPKAQPAHALSWPWAR